MEINEAIERLKNMPCECLSGKSPVNCEYKQCVHKRTIDVIVKFVEEHTK